MRSATVEGDMEMVDKVEIPVFPHWKDEVDGIAMEFGIPRSVVLAIVLEEAFRTGVFSMVRPQYSQARRMMDERGRG